MTGMSTTDHDLLITLHTKMDMLVQTMTAMQAEQQKDRTEMKAISDRVAVIEVDRASMIPTYKTSLDTQKDLVARLDKVEDRWKDFDSQSAGVTKMAGWMKAAILGIGFVITSAGSIGVYVAVEPSDQPVVHQPVIYKGQPSASH